MYERFAEVRQWFIVATLSVTCVTDRKANPPFGITCAWMPLFLKATFILMGIAILTFGLLKPKKEKFILASIALGIAYVFIGAMIDDPNNQVTFTPTFSWIAFGMSTITFSVLMAKLVTWVITKTDVYQKTVKALDSITKLDSICTDVADMKKTYQQRVAAQQRATQQTTQRKRTP